MSRLTDLLRQASKADPQLGADLEAEFRTLSKRRTFGLVFEQHQPEAVELPERAARRGDKVRILPPRGETKSGDKLLWRVSRLERAKGKRVAHLVREGAEKRETQVVPVDDVVVVAEFRDTVYPGLVETGRVERGGAKPFHTVINAENYHALEMLTYTHRHSVDAIYIDEKIKDYIVDLVFATRDPASFGLDMENLIEYGASPRATIYLTIGAKAYAFMKGRGYVTPQDVKSIGMDVLRHRVFVTYEAEAEEITSENIIQRIFDEVPVP